MPKEKYGRSEENLPAVFNMALSRLELLHGIAKQIVTISTFHLEDFENPSPLTEGQAQHLKARLVRQLFIQSVPLLDPVKDKDWKKEMNESTETILAKLKFIKVFKEQQHIGNKEQFDIIIETLLDKFTMEIQEKLQEHKYFMPSKSDPRKGWEQG